MGINPAALIWGFAEATLFFIVPDVWLSFAGREKLSKGIRACFFALAGALIGGTLMYAWGHLHAESAFQSLEKIPGINQPVIDQAGAELEHHGWTAILRAPLKGAPYKVYAVQSARLDMSVFLFLFISIPARLLRFLVTTVLIHFALHLVLGKKTARIRQFALILGWILFYAVYFARMGW